MVETAKNSQVTDIYIEKKAPERPWLRIDGESVLWFNRFRRYMDLGPKRSLQAAVEQERSQITALKSTKDVQKKEGAGRKKSSVQIKVLPPVKPQVPGSWKAASHSWNWVERAKAYDTKMIEVWTETHIEHAFTSIYSNTAGRLNALTALFEAEQKMFNANSSKMSFEQFNAAMARMQSILRDLRDETKLYDEDMTRQAMRSYSSEKYLQSFAKKE